MSLDIPNDEPWAEARLEVAWVRQWVQVPGLAACLVHVLETPVPWMWEDTLQCRARYQAWCQEQEAASRAKAAQAERDQIYANLIESDPEGDKSGPGRRRGPCNQSLG